MHTLGQLTVGPQTNGQPEPWLRIPVGLRERPQWCVTPGLDDDKAPRGPSGAFASVSDPATWTDFDTACRVAAGRGWHIGYMLHESDPFACIDLDVKEQTPAEHLQRFERIVSSFDSYTERSRSGVGFHVWLEGSIGRGRRRDGVEIYSQERFIVCTGDVVHDRPIASRPELLQTLVSEMGQQSDRAASGVG